MFEKEAKRLSKKYVTLIDDIQKLVTLLNDDPEQGIPLGKGLFKIRLAIESKGRGKSGGARIITYVYYKGNTVYLTSIFDKSELDNINKTAILKILKAAGIPE